MTRVLVIGNSHAAALRAAIAAGPADAPLTWGRLHITFAAAPDDAAGGLHLQENRLVVPDEAMARQFRRISGRDAFALQDHDVVVFCGGLVIPRDLIRLHFQARWFPLPSAQDLPPGKDLISAQVALAVVAGKARKALLWPLLVALHDRGGMPLIALQTIRFSQDGIGTGQRMRGATRVARSADAAALSDFYDRATEATLSPLARVLLQPPETRARHFFTQPAFRRGATRLAPATDVPQPDTDFLHGNAAYGALMLDAIATALDCA